MRHHSFSTTTRSQRGVVLLYALIAIVLLMVSGAALVRGVATALAVSGNYALRRDLLNEGELGISSAKAEFSGSGALALPTNRNSSSTLANYSAVTLADQNGIPLALLDDGVFAATGDIRNDAAGGTYGVSIRFVIDRLCNSQGPPTLTNCAAYQRTGDKGGTNWLQKAGNTFQPIYRVTVRVTGPKNTITFLQTTLGA